MISREMPVWLLPDGTEVKLGNKLPPADLVLRVRGTLPDIPESEWREFDLREDPKYPVKIKDQGRYGACNGHAAASSLEIARYIAGLGHVDLSAWLIYADLCGGWDRGSSIAEALVLLQNKGTCSDSLVPHGTINPRQIGEKPRQDAPRFRIEIGYLINSFRDLCIASQLRKPFDFSVPVNSGFNELDKDGVPQNRPGWHNHAVAGGISMKKTRGDWLVGSQNSWTERWGNKGYFNTAERTIEGSGFEAYTVEAVTIDPLHLPPVAITSAFPDSFSGYPVLT